jgi:hypothetical protein
MKQADREIIAGAASGREAFSRVRPFAARGRSYVTHGER